VVYCNRLERYTNEDQVIESGLVEESDDDWYFYGIKNAKFEASGDSNKLIFLLMKFKELAENATTRLET